MDYFRGFIWYMMGHFAVEIGWVLGFLLDRTTAPPPWWAGLTGGLIVVVWSGERYMRLPAKQKEPDAGD